MAAMEIFIACICAEELLPISPYPSAKTSLVCLRVDVGTRLLQCTMYIRLYIQTRGSCDGLFQNLGFLSCFTLGEAAMGGMKLTRLSVSPARASLLQVASLDFPRLPIS